MDIVVAGGSGFLGSALTRALRADGHRVRILSRRARRADDVQWVPGGGDTGWGAVVARADAVVNLAGEPIADRRWSTARKEAILDSRVRATRALAEAIRAAAQPPEVFISASGVGYYGVRGDETLTEDSPPGSGFLAQVCRAWESVAMAAPTRVVTLRTGLVLAKHGGALPQLARPFYFFVGGPLGSGRQYMSWIHLDDWVGLVRFAIAQAAVAGPLNMTAPQPVPNAAFARTLARVLRRPALLPAPAAALKLALGEMAGEMILGGQRVLPAKAQALGYAFSYAELEPALRAVFDHSPVAGIR